MHPCAGPACTSCTSILVQLHISDPLSALLGAVQESQGRMRPPSAGAAGSKRGASASASGTLEPHPGATQPWEPPAPKQQQQQQAPSSQQQEPAQEQQRSVINVREIQRAVPAGGVIELLVPSAGGVTGVVYTCTTAGGNQVGFATPALASLQVVLLVLRSSAHT